MYTVRSYSGEFETEREMGSKAAISRDRELGRAGGDLSGGKERRGTK